MNHTAIFTALVIIIGFLATMLYAISTQMIIIPNQVGYIEVRHNDLVTTPNQFDVRYRNAVHDYVKGE